MSINRGIYALWGLLFGERGSMIKSMTGFGRSEYTENGQKFTVEMKSVNNRYLDISIKMPRQLNPFEAAIRSELKQFIQRGKVDVFISYEDLTEAGLSVRYNKKLAAEYYEKLQEMAADFGLENDVRISMLSRYPDVLVMEEEDPDNSGLWEILKKAIDLAAQEFVAARTREGEFLRNDLVAKLDVMLENVDFITDRAPKIVEAYKASLYAKVRDLLAESTIDDARILSEVTIYSDKVCIDEELVRLRSHITTTRAALMEEENVGRKLDFIAQEMNREANTILSKSDDLEVSSKAIELKTSIEKVREQIQNVE